MNDDELIHRIAHRMDPLVFEHEGSQPPGNFFGSPEWWATAKHSRRKRATEGAAAAVEAIRALGLAVVPREATTAVARAGAACPAPQGASAADRERWARDAWQAMLAVAERQDADRTSAPSRGAVGAFPTVIRKGA